MIEKTIDMKETVDGHMVVRGENAPIAYCLVNRIEMQKRFKNIGEVVIKRHLVGKAIIAMQNAGCKVNII